MLLYFKFKNYKSFHEESILDLRASKISDHEEGVSEIFGKRILNIAGIFGANASGKSNALDAMSYMFEYIKHSFKYDEESKDEDDIMNTTPFLFDQNSSEEPSFFEVEYIAEQEKGKIFKYGFEIDGDGIKQEWLFSSSKTSRGKYKKIFTREDNSLDLSGLPSSGAQNIKAALDKYSLVLSLGAKLKVKRLQNIKSWFEGSKFTDFGDPFYNFMISRRPPNNILNKKVQENVLKYLSVFDSSIVGFDVKRINVEETNGKSHKAIRIYAKHKIKNSQELRSILMENESAGTLKMFVLYQAFYEIFNYGGVLVIDELNGRLHPLLVETIIRAFHNKQVNKKNGQLIFTSHDALSINKSLLRRDEICFVEKNEFGESKLYSLAGYREDDKKIRKDENYEKNYIAGKYGAIPELKGFEDVF